MNTDFLSIGELCQRAGIKTYTLRYWEKEFGDFLKPHRSKGGHRRYREDDLKVLLRIKQLLKEKKYTIKGAREILNNSLVKSKEEEEKSYSKGNFFQKKKILITGGTGTIGKEITRKLIPLNPSVIRIYSRDETKQFKMREEFRDVENIRYFVGDIRDVRRLEMAMEEVDIVFHLAALKQVASCEYNPFEAINTNVYGSQNVINAALRVNAEKVIFTSTDKAVNPTSIMGATKLMAEKLFTAANYYKGKRRTVFASVRFGNVLGSRDSVISLFNNQLLHGKPVVLKSKKMTGFIISWREAVNFILKATLLAKEGEVFVPKMPAVRIIDLIEIIEESLGFNKDIREVGANPGEKIYEELMTEDEGNRALERDDMYIILPTLRNHQISKYLYPDTYVLTRDNPHTSEKGPFLSKPEVKKLLKKEGII